MEGCLIRILFFLLPSLAWADSVNNEWFSTTRSLSMGNAAIACAEDGATAMFYNPAALARTKKASVEPFNFQIDVGSGVLNAGREIGDHASLTQTRPHLLSAPNSPSSLGAALYPNVNTQNFNFGILARGEGASYYDGTNVHYRSEYFLIPTMGLSFSAIGGRLRLGAAVRGVQATTNDREVSGTSTQEIGYTVDAQEGFGFGLDGGMLLSLPTPGLPTLGLVARNVGDTTFSQSAPVGIATGTVERKQKIKMTYDAGFSLSPKFGKRSGLVFAVDYRDILQQHDVATLRRINLGLELEFSRVIYLRAGVSRGYWTAGVGLSSKYGSLDIGSYAEELNRTEFRSVEDRRYSLRYGSRF